MAVAGGTLVLRDTLQIRRSAGLGDPTPTTAELMTCPTARGCSVNGLAGLQILLNVGC